MDTRTDLQNQIQTLTGCNDYEATVAIYAMESTLRPVIYAEWLGFRGPGGDIPPESVRDAARALSFWLLNLCAGLDRNITHDQSTPLADEVLSFLHRQVMELRQATA
jgi:hypothetical protein